MHVHHDHDNCLETLAVRGPSGKVPELADLLLGAKGVQCGKLLRVATEAVPWAVKHATRHMHHHER